MRIASVQENPLITFAVSAYNQEAYVKDAIEGALAQDYSPLEIVLSDDASTDHTGDIMKRIAREYRGPHQVVVRQSPHNAGIGEHVNALFRVARGEWLVVCAGDDISLPHRVSVLARHVSFKSSDIAAAYSSMEHINERSKTIGLYSVCDASTRLSVFSGKACAERSVFGTWPGASAAYRRDVWHKFGPIPASTVNEDRILFFRAMLVGNIAAINQVLLKYRLNVGLATASRRARNWSERRRLSLRMHSCRADSAMQMISDAVLSGVSGEAKSVRELLAIAESEKVIIEAIRGRISPREVLKYWLRGMLTRKQMFKAFALYVADRVNAGIDVR